MVTNTLRDALFCCSAINIVLYFVAHMFFVLGHGFVYRTHVRWWRHRPDGNYGKWCVMSEEQFDSTYYKMMMLYRLCIVFFNVVPYLALCIVD